MATKNFVPRATGEGQLGTDSKKWDKHIAISGAYSYVSASSKGSFGSLFVGGNSELAGNLTLGGNITIGDADTDSLVITADLSSSIVPDADSTYNIGSTTKNWKYGYIEELASTNITASNNISASGNVTVTGTLRTDGNVDFNGDLDVDGTTNLDVVDIDGAVDMASTLTLADNADFDGDLDVDGTTNLDNTDIDGTLTVDGSNTTITSNVISFVGSITGSSHISASGN